MEWIKKNKKLSIAILIGVVVLICVGLGIYFISKNNTSEKANKESTEKTVESQEDTEEVQDEADATEDTNSETVVDETTQTESSEVAGETAETTQPSTSTNDTTASSNSSNTTNKTPSGSTTSGNATTSPSTNATTTTPTTNQTYETFAEKIGVYTTKNLPPENPYNDDLYPAWIGVYSVGQSETVNNQIKVKFKEAFGFDATAEVVCTYIGKYKVTGYTTAQDIYQYTIKDTTYPLFQDEFYVIKKQLCTDGSPWVGFATPDPYDSTLVSALNQERMKVFCEWTGYTSQEVYYDTDRFIANALIKTTWRTTDGQVMQIIYRYTCGKNIPMEQ